MAYFTESQIGAEPESIGDFDPSFGLSLGTAVEDAFISNPTKVIYDYTKIRSANQGERLDKTQAEERVKESGVSVKIPALGYTQDALDMVIERKQDEMNRQSILDRAPAGILPSTARFTASLLTSVLDPINVASAFVPVVGQERYASMVAGAAGGFGRAGVRFGVGAAEGAVGAALIEPINLALRTQMQDDYTMVDSLINVGFGTALGGGLHVGGGVLKDVYRPRIGELSKASVEDVHVTEMANAIAPHKPSADSMAAKIDAVAPETRAASLRVAVAQSMEGRIPDVDPIIRADPQYNLRQWFGASKVIDEAGAPLQVYHGTPDGSFDTFDANLRGRNTGNNPEDVAFHFTDKPESANYYASLSGNLDAPSGAIMPAYLQLKNPLISSEKVINAEDIANAKAAGHDGIIATNTIKDGKEYIVFSPEQIKSSTGNSGAYDPNSSSMTDAQNALTMAKESARRATSPESIAVADFPAAQAASERLALAPQGDDAATKALESTLERLDQLTKNLELRGMSPEKVAEIRAALKPFDDDLKDAQKLGDAARAYVVCNL